MNFYPFHIGDYASETRHLTWAEDLAYRRLLDLYYTREGPLPAERRQLYRLVLASTEEQREAVDAILSEFFIESPGEGYLHNRCEVEIAAAQDKREKASKSAKARWGDAKERDVADTPEADAMRDPSPEHSDRNANACSEGCECIEKPCVRHAPNPNPNPNPKEEPNGSSRQRYVPPEWVPAEQWTEFVRMRKAMRNVPFTAAAAEGVVRELNKLRGEGYDPAALLDLAVTSGWRTVYPPRSQGPPVNGHKNGHSGSKVRAARMAEAVPDLAARCGTQTDFIDVEANDVTPRRLG